MSVFRDGTCMTNYVLGKSGSFVVYKLKITHMPSTVGLIGLRIKNDKKNRCLYLHCSCRSCSVKLPCFSLSEMNHSASGRSSAMTSHIHADVIIVRWCNKLSYSLEEGLWWWWRK